MRNKTRTARRLPPRGLTVIELLVATMLASMLMVAVLGILRILSTREKVLLEGVDGVTWRRPLLDQVRFDLANAHRFEVAPDRLRLLGYGARDFGTQQTTHRPAEIVYRVVAALDQSWLVREEIHPDAPAESNVRRQIIGSGIRQIAMEISGEKQHRPRRSGVVPNCFRLTFSGNVALDEPVTELLYCR